MTMIDRKAIRHFLAEDVGQDLLEYGLIVAVLALGAIAGLKSVATNVAILFGAVATTLTTAL